MAKQLLVENYVCAPGSAVEITKDNYEEYGLKGNRLVEGVLNKDAKVLKEDSEVNKVLKAFAERGITETPRLWRVPVSRVNTVDKPNINGRAYTQPLWENVINEQRDAWCGGCGLADHPEDDNKASFKDQTVLWLGAELEEDIVYGIGAFLTKGANGAMAEQILDLGGKVGFSTYGYGEFEPDGITVTPDTYEIVRLADCVLQPSQSVYGDNSMEVSSKNIEQVKQPVKDSVIRESKETNMENNEVLEEGKKKNNTDVSGVGNGGHSFAESEMKNEFYTNKLNKIKADGTNTSIEMFDALLENVKADSFEGKDELVEAIEAKLNKSLALAEKLIETGRETLKTLSELGIEDLAALKTIAERAADFDTLTSSLSEANKANAKLKARVESIEESYKAYADGIEADDKTIAAQAAAAEQRVRRFKERIAKLVEENEAANTKYLKLKEAFMVLEKDNRVLTARVKAQAGTIRDLKEEQTALNSAYNAASKIVKVKRAEEREAARMYRATHDLTQHNLNNGKKVPMAAMVESYVEDLSEQYSDILSEKDLAVIGESKTYQEAQNKLLKILSKQTGSDGVADVAMKLDKLTSDTSSLSRKFN